MLSDHCAVCGDAEDENYIKPRDDEYDELPLTLTPPSSPTINRYRLSIQEVTVNDVAEYDTIDPDGYHEAV